MVLCSFAPKVILKIGVFVRMVSRPLGSVKPNHQWLEAVHIRDQCMVLLNTILDNCLRYWEAARDLWKDGKGEIEMCREPERGITKQQRIGWIWNESRSGDRRNVECLEINAPCLKRKNKKHFTVCTWRLKNSATKLPYTTWVSTCLTTWTRKGNLQRICQSGHWSKWCWWWW